MISMISFGVRSAFGLFADPFSHSHNWPREIFAFSLAIQNIAWGLSQPIAGYIADRFGAFRVLVGGGIAYVAGMVWMIFGSHPIGIHMSAVLVGVGIGGASFVTVVSVLTKIIPESHRAWAVGIGTAAGSLGQFLIVPLLQIVIDSFGWVAGAWMAAAGLLTIPVLALVVRAASANPAAAGRANAAPLQGRSILQALKHPSYQLLVAGFFACGFQLAFITAHFPMYLNDTGLGQGVASWALALIGLCNIIGTYVAGVLSGKYSKRLLLAWLYFARAALIAAFVATPPSSVSVLIFALCMGLTWLSTVPPTSGLIATFFGTSQLATLFGFAFLSHQVGAFLGVWMGAATFAATGSYMMIWWAAAVVSVAAGLLHLPIRERAAPAWTFANSHPA